MNRVIVCGSRRWRNREAIASRLADIDPKALIVIGYNPEEDTPKGADRIAYQEAQKLGFLIETHPAKWDKFGKAAGPIRNQEMASLGADLCIAFRYSEHSTGTDDMMKKARKAGIPVEEIR